MVSSGVITAVARRLEGKVALITGAASGIGECTARLFSKHGARVVIADVQDELGESVCKDIGLASASFVHCDVTKESDVEIGVNTTISKYGKLDIMFNNAGVAGEAKPNILYNYKAEFEQVHGVNLVGPFLGTKHVARVMIPARRGRITTASICSTIVGVGPHAYMSSKHAVVGLTRKTEAELWQYGIRVNCVSPYVVTTPMAREFLKMGENGCHRIYFNLNGAILKPEDVVESVLYLGSDDSQYVSGHNLIIDGGFTIVNPKLSCLNPLNK